MAAVGFHWNLVGFISGPKFKIDPGVTEIIYITEVQMRFTKARVPQPADDQPRDLLGVFRNLLDR